LQCQKPAGGQRLELADPGFSQVAAERRSRACDRSPAVRSALRLAAVDPLLPATVFATADRYALKAYIDLHPGAAT